MLTDSLAAFWRSLEELNRPVAGLRVPGPDATGVAAAIGGPVPDEIAVWFGWSDGARYEDGQVQDDAALVPGYEPLSLVEAVAVRDRYGERDPLLDGTWVPLIASGGGDF